MYMHDFFHQLLVDPYKICQSMRGRYTGLAGVPTRFLSFSYFPATRCESTFSMNNAAVDCLHMGGWLLLYKLRFCQEFVNVFMIIL